MYEFAYCYAIDNKVNWSSETAESLMLRMKNDDRTLVEDFIANAAPGSFITLSSGELVFCVCAPDRDTPELLRDRLTRLERSGV